MATFAKKTFDAARYAAARPTYPTQFYDFIFGFHARDPRAKWDTALDLGCGTGQATLELVPRFAHVIGSDPSSRMIAQATKSLDSDSHLKERVRFVQSPAEELGWLEDGSVDMIVSAQAAHWFDWTRLWPEAARVLRPGGSLAVWGYSQFRLTHHPSCTPLIHAYSQGTHALGPHWERPGRTILDEHLLAIPSPSGEAWGEFQREYFTGDHYPSLPAPHPVLLKKRTTWAGVLGYLRTFSALHNFHEAHPEDLQRPEGDIAERFWRELRERVAQDKGVEAEGEEDEVEIEWPMALLLARRA